MIQVPQEINRNIKELIQHNQNSNIKFLYDFDKERSLWLDRHIKEFVLKIRRQEKELSICHKSSCFNPYLFVLSLI